jgi:hypothetical protein
MTAAYYQIKKEFVASAVTSEEQFVHPKIVI